MPMACSPIPTKINRFFKMQTVFIQIPKGDIQKYCENLDISFHNGIVRNRDFQKKDIVVALQEQCCCLASLLRYWAAR